MKRIGIFGGTFDPVHNEHLAMAAAAVSGLRLDKLYVVPAYLPPHKPGRKLTDSSDRFIMAKFAFKPIAKAEVSPFELNEKGASYTYLTAEHFAAQFPGAKLYFIMGEDMFENFPTWKCPERVLAACELAVCRREDGGADMKKAKAAFKKFGRPFTELAYVGKAVSSTEVRVRAMLGLAVGSLVPESVARYIADNELYRGAPAVGQGAKMLSDKRREHTAGVCELALRYAKTLGADRERTLLAAALHDVAKNARAADYPDFRLKEDVPPPVLHAYLGAYLAETQLGVRDAEVLDAIRFHTSGRAGMCDLEKIVYCADLLEKGRDFPEAAKLRKAVSRDFEAGFRACLAHEYKYLVKTKEPWDIFRRTQEAYEYYCK